MFLPLILSFLLVSAPALAHNNENCSKLLSKDSPAAELSKLSSEIIYQNLKSKGMQKTEARGYAILIAAMIGSAAATTYLTASLPNNFQFLSHFLAQVSTLGVYVFGAPIWEPLSSGFRKLAFGVRGSTTENQPRPGDSGFESLWRRTQENYSLNAQMSRNVINQFIISVQQNFYQAHQAVHSNNPEYAADQIAAAAYRLRVLFREIPPDETSVAVVVRTAFTHHVHLDEHFAEIVLKKVRELDSDFETMAARTYYHKIVEAWLSH